MYRYVHEKIVRERNDNGFSDKISQLRHDVLYLCRNLSEK